LLATLLRQHRDSIAARWTERLCQLQGSRYGQCAPEELLQWSTSAIDAIARSRDAGVEELEAHARVMAGEREAQGFEVDEVIEGLLLLGDTVLPYVAGAAGDSPALAVGMMRELGADMRVMAAQFARLFAESKRRTAEQVAVLEERQRLARDLHDSVSQSLYGVSMWAEAAARLLEGGQIEEAAANLRDARNSATEALREMRFLIFELRPSILHEDGLVGALRARLSGVEERVGLRAVLRAEGIGRLPFVIEEALYGIAREALNNSLRHAHATRLDVRLQVSSDAVVMEVADNGVGFNVASTGGGGLGLGGMRERAERIGASLSVDSAPRRGTAVRVRAPLAAAGPQQAATPEKAVPSS